MGEVVKHPSSPVTPQELLEGLLKEEKIEQVFVVYVTDEQYFYTYTDATASDFLVASKVLERAADDLLFGSDEEE